MGSHYIPVGKIKIDKEILDIACPAAGYGNTPPDPELYCPANGYVNPSEPMIDLEGIPEVGEIGDAEVIIIVADILEETGSINLPRDAGNLNYEIYGENDVLLDSGSTSSGLYSYNIANLTGGYQGNGMKFYKFVFSPDTGQHIVQLYNVPPSTIKVFVYTPFLTYMRISDRSFMDEILLPATLDNLTYGLNFCQNTPSLRKVTLPTSMQLLEKLDSWFRNTGLTELVWECNLPSAYSMQYFGYQSKIMYANLKFTVGVPDPHTYLNPQYFLSSSQIKTAIIEFVSAKNISTSAILNGCTTLTNFILKGPFFFNSNFLSNSIIATSTDNTVELSPAIPVTPSNQPILANNVGVKKLVVGANHNATQSGFIVMNTSAVEEIVFMPIEMVCTATSLQTPFGGSAKLAKLKKVTMPQRISQPNLNNPLVDSFYAFNVYCPNLEELSSFETVDFTFSNLGGTSGFLKSKKLKIFNQPNLSFWSSISVNMTSASPGSLEYFDINFENSFIIGCSTTVNFSYQQFDAAELNRIFTKFPNSTVPTGTGMLRIQITGCPGAATCDRTIVENKGWTVL